MTGKYDVVAERFTELEYGDPSRYFGRRAGIVVELGPPLAPGDTVLDLACADGSAAPALLAHDLRYVGVDASPAMVDVARRRLADLSEPPGRLRSGSDPGETEGTVARVQVGDLLTYAPPAPVAATTLFRSLHLVSDRRAFFRRVAEFTVRKLVFDASPRRYPLERLRAELRAAGFTGLATRPFLVPQHVRLPGPAASLLDAVEPTWLGRFVLRYRFTLMAAAFRDPGS